MNDVNGPPSDVLVAECEKYGLPHDLKTLLQHIYANRDATYGAKDRSIEILRKKLDDIRSIVDRYKDEGEHIPPHVIEGRLDARP